MTEGLSSGHKLSNMENLQRKHNREIVPTAKMLRKNMTTEEKHLWYDFLSTYPVRFSRQKVLGKYIVDFYCPQAKLVVELDGSQHYTEKGLREDLERTSFLEQYGLQIFRIKNRRIRDNFKRVCEEIDAIVNSRLEK